MWHPCPVCSYTFVTEFSAVSHYIARHRPESTHESLEMQTVLYQSMLNSTVCESAEDVPIGQSAGATRGSSSPPTGRRRRRKQIIQSEENTADEAEESSDSDFEPAPKARRRTAQPARSSDKTSKRRRCEGGSGNEEQPPGSPLASKAKAQKEGMNTSPRISRYFVRQDPLFTHEVALEEARCVKKRTSSRTDQTLAGELERSTDEAAVPLLSLVGDSDNTSASDLEPTGLNGNPAGATSKITAEWCSARYLRAHVDDIEDVDSPAVLQRPLAQSPPTPRLHQQPTTALGRLVQHVRQILVEEAGSAYRAKLIETAFQEFTNLTYDGLDMFSNPRSFRHDILLPSGLRAPQPFKKLAAHSDALLTAVKRASRPAGSPPSAGSPPQLIKIYTGVPAIGRGPFAQLVDDSEDEQFPDTNTQAAQAVSGDGKLVSATAKPGAKTGPELEYSRTPLSMCRPPTPPSSILEVAPVPNWLSTKKMMTTLRRVKQEEVEAAVTVATTAAEPISKRRRVASPSVFDFGGEDEESDVGCPLCEKRFPRHCIEEHAALCEDDNGQP